MILGFLGKGGSGKSTIATLFVRYLLEHKKRVLAVDNDHNMDLSYNLGVPEGVPYMGHALKEVFSFMGITSTMDTLSLPQDFLFSLSPKDPITQKYTVERSPDFFVMVSGPHTEDIMLGKQCSHVLTTPLKAYLPFLKVNEDEYVVVDEKAGADGVGTGVTTGFHAAVIIVEPTPHGIKAALQISKMLRFYNTPYVYILNKVRPGADRESLVAALGEVPLGAIPYSEEALDLHLTNEAREVFSKILEVLTEKTDTRKERSQSRLQKLAALQ